MPWVPWRSSQAPVDPSPSKQHGNPISPGLPVCMLCIPPHARREALLSARPRASFRSASSTPLIHPSINQSIHHVLHPHWGHSLGRYHAAEPRWPTGATDDSYIHASPLLTCSQSRQADARPARREAQADPVTFSQRALTAMARQAACIGGQEVGHPKYVGQGCRHPLRQAGWQSACQSGLARWHFVDSTGPAAGRRPPE